MLLATLEVSSNMQHGLSQLLHFSSSDTEIICKNGFREIWKISRITEVREMDFGHKLCLEINRRDLFPTGKSAGFFITIYWLIVRVCLSCVARDLRGTITSTCAFSSFIVLCYFEFFILTSLYYFPNFYSRPNILWK